MCLTLYSRFCRFKRLSYKLSLSRQLTVSTALQKKSSKIQKLPGASYDVVTIPGDKKDVSIPLPKSYSSKFTEAAWYDWWEKQGYFQPSTAKEKFVMLLPPPNVTGKLHIGHAFTGAIQDAIVRWNRMRGLSTLWIPGLDHAGIATQVIVEKHLWKDEQLTRHEIGRHAFLKAVWNWKHRRAEEITAQIKRMGLSLDWSRSTFTMDDKMKEAVTHAFCQLYDDGLISRNVRIVNWSCQLKSAIADIEVDTIHIDGPTPFKVPGYSREVTLGYLTSFAYPIYNSDSNEEIVVATTRLETLLGDTAIAVHPDDERYKHLHGTHAIHPFSDRLIPIIADEFVQPDVGTGAVKLTPSHSVIDHEISQKHKLRHINILNDDGTLSNCSEQFNGMKRFDARERVAQMLQKKGLWRGQAPHPMSVPICSRSLDVIEPRLKEQWFLDCSGMAKAAMLAADEKRIEFIPSYHHKMWRHFLQRTSETPWCISRQLWWGHNIPAYKLIDMQSKSETSVGWIVAPSFTEAIRKSTEQLGHSEFKLVQDSDVLDTWFSSSLLPFGSLGWPNQNANLLTFYPGHMIESGSDILFFWIARMVMLSEKLTGVLPFRQILIHSLLLSQGKKMSKSKGNVIDPMSIIEGSSLTELEKSLESGNMDRKDMAEALAEQKRQFSGGIPECGADTLRMTLCSYPFKGDAVNIQVSTFLEYRSLCNKIWQIFRFYSQYFTPDFAATDIEKLKNLTSIDWWILDRSANLVEVCEESFRHAELDLITHKIKSFWTTDLSKIYLECSKSTLINGSDAERQATLSVAVAAMSVAIRCMAPFMPYLAEELFQRLPCHGKAESICIAPFPTTQQWSAYRSKEIERHFMQMLEISSCVKTFKTQFDLLHQSKRIGTVYIMCPPMRAIPKDILFHLETYCRLQHVHIDSIPEDIDRVCQIDMDQSSYSIFIDLSESLHEQSELELEKMSSRLHHLLKSQRKLLDQTLHLDMSETNDEDRLKHRTKVENMKKEVEFAEKSVNYLLNMVNNSSGDHK